MLGVKYYKDKFYLAMPKIKKGSPVTLAYMPKIPNDGSYKNPLLTPYPNWKTHTSNDCETILQNLQSMEIDNAGIMWVIDGRRTDKTDHKCPPKIVLLDLNNLGRTVQSYVVPNEVCSHESCALNDLVLDDADGGYAYITDSSATDPGLIIYSKRQNRAWKVRDPTMFAEEAARNFTAHGILQPGRNNINGIALQQKSSGDDKRLLYYTAQSAFVMYSVDTELLRNESLAKTEVIHRNIVNVGRKTAQSAGMIVDSTGQLYYGIMTEDAVYRWNTKKPLSTQVLIEKNPELMPWPDSYAFDKSGGYYMIERKMKRLQIVVLNTNLLTGSTDYAPRPDEEEAKNQWDWLERVLTKCLHNKEMESKRYPKAIETLLMRDNGREELSMDQQAEKCQLDEEVQHYEFAYKSGVDQIGIARTNKHQLVGPTMEVVLLSLTLLPCNSTPASDSSTLHITQAQLLHEVQLLHRTDFPTIVLESKNENIIAMGAAIHIKNAYGQLHELSLPQRSDTVQEESQSSEPVSMNIIRRYNLRIV
ncbi:yellow-b [Carabus blaptoides fortunei]